MYVHPNNSVDDMANKLNKNINERSTFQLLNVKSKVSFSYTLSSSNYFHCHSSINKKCTAKSYLQSSICPDEM